MSRALTVVSRCDLCLGTGHNVQAFGQYCYCNTGRRLAAWFDLHMTPVDDRLRIIREGETAPEQSDA